MAGDSTKPIDTRPGQAWQNWSGSQQHQPAALVVPEAEADLAELLARAANEGRRVRAIGSAHSFVPFWTDDYLVSLDHLSGLVGHDTERGQATFWAGTKLHAVGEPLWHLGLGMPNMGDIDRQSLAGAISTGTHGTGAGLKSISNQVVAMRLVNADGDILELDDTEPELLRAAQVSMGSLGVVTQVTLQAVPAYYLHERNWLASVDECSEARAELIANNRHFEFFWDPQADKCAMKTLNPCAAPASGQVFPEGESVGRSYEVFPSDRDMRFNETEFSVPAEAGWDCFLALRQMMQTRFPEVRWPLEYRTLKADDLLLSSACGRETVTISAHQGAKYPYQEFFSATEDVFRRFDGRPHWGKVHTHKAAELRDLLPGFERFQTIRRTLDPQGRFLNPFLAGVFGID